MGGEFSYILSLVACFDQWFVLCVEDLSRVHPIFCLFLFLFVFFFAINVEVSEPQNNEGCAAVGSTRFLDCHNGYNNNRQE